MEMNATFEPLVQSDFLHDLCAEEIDNVPVDSTDLIFDAYENDDFWLLPNRQLQKQFLTSGLENRMVACQHDHHGYSQAGHDGSSKDASTQVETITDLHYIPAETRFARSSIPTHVATNRAVKQAQPNKKVHTPRSKRSTQKKMKRKESATDSALVLPLSAYNFFFRVERIRLLEVASDDVNSEWLHNPFNAVAFYAHILSGSSREFQEMVLCDQWGRDPNAKRKHRKSHGMISFRNLARLISQSWRILPDEYKQVFHSISARDFKRYESEKSKGKCDAGTNSPLSE